MKLPFHLIKNFLFTVFILAVIESYPQAAMPANLRASYTIDRLSGFQGNNVPDLLYGIPSPPGKVIGDTYLDMEWKTSTILLYEGKMIEGYPARFDIQLNELELNAKNGIKVLAGSKVRNFVWIDDNTKTPDYFVNAKEFKNSSKVAMLGFFQVLSDGDLPLLKKTDIIVKKADYNAVLNVGSRDDKIIKKSDLYYAKAGQVFKAPTSRKKVLSLFGERSAQVGKFMKDNSLTITKEDDLVKIFDYFNNAAVVMEGNR